jgi:hypothetical protein
VDGASVYWTNRKGNSTDGAMSLMKLTPKQAHCSHRVTMVIASQPIATARA